ncbi:hypothetical protein ACFV30_31450 [Streptomyces sp. NPDC059752]|uniref:hypothetical protein n=1 Tax=unclassified Streptomyces TaxID=2593676 RepID=UPI003668141A
MRGMSARVLAPLPAATLAVSGSGGRTRTVRVDDPVLHLADDAQGTDRLSGRAKEDNADALAELGDGPVGMNVKRLTVAGSAPLAVLGDFRVSERARPGRAGSGWSCPGRPGCGAPPQERSGWSGT